MVFVTVRLCPAESETVSEIVKVPPVVYTWVGFRSLNEHADEQGNGALPGNPAQEGVGCTGVRENGGLLEEHAAEAPEASLEPGRTIRAEKGESEQGHPRDEDRDEEGASLPSAEQFAVCERER